MFQDVRYRLGTTNEIAVIQQPVSVTGNAQVNLFRLGLLGQQMPARDVEFLLVRRQTVRRCRGDSSRRSVTVFFGEWSGWSCARPRH